MPSVVRVVHQVDPDPIATSRVVGRAHACDVCGARVVRAHFLSLGRGRAGGWLRYGCCGSRPPGGYGLVRTTPAAAPGPAPDGHVTCTMQYHDVMTLVSPIRKARNLVLTINENDRNKRIRKRGEKREKDEKEEGNGGRGEEDNKGNTGGIKYDIYYIQDFINNIEKKVKEIKEKNQFIIPEKIRNRYPNICNKNIFMEVKNMNINEMVLCNQLKVIGIEETDYNNRIILGDRTPEVYEHRRNIYRIKNEKIEQIMAYRKQKTQYDKDITCELENNKYKHSGWIFY